LSPREWRDRLRLGWEARVRADPSFAFKSLAEVALAVAAQLAAECAQGGGAGAAAGGAQGARRLFTEIDFVVGGVLTAVAGKYLAMWKVAKTTTPTPEGTKGSGASPPLREPRVFGLAVPTNAFQEFLMDGVTRPTLRQRAGSFAAPVVPLFQAGAVSSLLGYGITAALVAARARVVPSYVSRTREMNLLHATLYTGAFVATVSNVRYQVLQGVVEPAIADLCSRVSTTSRSPGSARRRKILERGLRGSLIFAVRVANGTLGSYLAIAGMRWLGLRRLKAS
jgi:hypothetical protein